MANGSDRTTVRSFLAFLGLAALVLFFYHDSLNHAFVSDDSQIILRGGRIDDWKNARFLFSREYLRGPEAGETFDQMATFGEVTYRPVSTLSYFAMHSLFGTRPSGYHAASLILHAVNAWLLFLIAHRLGIGGGPAWIAAALFATTPAHLEVLNVVTFNEDLLALLFMSLAILVRRRSTAAATAFYILGCLSKETAFILPALFALEDVLVHSKKISARTYLPFAAAGLAYAWIWGGVMGSSSNSFPGGGVFNVPYAFARYAIWTVFPFGVFPGFPGNGALTAPDGRFWAASAAVTLIGALLVLQRKKNPCVTLGGAWWFLALLPLVPLSKNYMAPRYLYVPSAGFFLAAAAAAAAVGGMRRKALGLAGAAAVGTFGVAAAVGNFAWRNDVAISSTLVEREPDVAGWHSMLAREYQKTGQLNYAISEARVALAIEPGRTADLIRIGMSYLAKGRAADAVPPLKEAARLHPERWSAHAYLGIAYGTLGNYSGSIESFEKALSIRPDSPDVLQNLSATYARMGDTAKASETAGKAEELRKIRAGK